MGDPVKASITIERLEPTRANVLIEAIYSSYGDSYDHAWVYDIEAVAARLENQTMVSFVACAPDGQVVGHTGLLRDSDKDPVGESGLAVVHPDWRGNNLFPTLKARLAQWCKEEGVLGMYSEATAAHPYSQVANIHLGATETGFLLGYIPAEVSYKKIDTKKTSQRLSVALFWLATSELPTRTSYPPTWHRDVIEKLYEHNDLTRSISPGVESIKGITSLLATERADDHNDAFITVLRQGSDLMNAIEHETATLKSEGYNAIYLDFELSDPATGVLPIEIHDELGFFFGGIIPEAKDGDILRFQHLHQANVDIQDISTASDFGQELLEYVFERKRLAPNSGQD